MKLLKINNKLIHWSIVLCFCCPTIAQTGMKVGAAKVDITPKPENLPADIKSIQDNMYIRAVVIDNGVTKAALISIDAGVREDGWLKYTQQIEKEFGIPALNIFISPSHSHSSFMGVSATDPKMALFVSTVDKAMVEVIKQAKASLQPAKVGYGTGSCFLNINRDVIDPVTRLWSQGNNYEGISDKTVAVIKFETLTGEPIAVYYNYAMHPNTMYMTGVVSADFPGVTSKYIEEYYNDKVVALWSMGAAGDQNPRYFISSVNFNRPDQTQGNATPAGGQPQASTQTNPRSVARKAQMISSLGQLLGEEVLRVMDLTTRMDNKIRLYGSQDIVTCPGRTRTNTGRQGAPGTYVDGDSVKIKLSLLMLGDIALTGVNAEVYNPILLRLKNESSYKNLIMATTTNGSANSGYIPSDDAFVRYTFQVLGSRLQPGNAESAVVNGLLDMMDNAK
jgi:neutral ceramidase